MGKAEAHIPSRNFAVKLGQDEVSRILGLKGDLDYSEDLEEAARTYCRLGWSMVAVNARGEDLGIDFRQPSESWAPALADLSWQQVQPGLAVRTGKASHLLVMELPPGCGPLGPLDREVWQAETVAATPQGRERHFYALPGDHQGLPAVSRIEGVTVYGDGGQVLVPPSRALPDGAWHWRTDPQEKPPHYPTVGLWRFLREHRVLQPPPGAPPGWEPPLWEEIYQHISGHPQIIQALLAPMASPEEYYLLLAQTAWAAGLRDAALLLGLLWHAPLGDARQRPGRLEYLQQLAADPPRWAEAAAGPEGGPPPAMPARVHICQPADLSPEMWARFFQMVTDLATRLTGDGREEALLQAWRHSYPGPPPPMGGSQSRPLGTAGPPWGRSDLLDHNRGWEMAPCQQELIQYFLNNYILINPLLAGLPEKEQLAMAQRMVQEFLRH